MAHPLRPSTALFLALALAGGAFLPPPGTAQAPVQPQGEAPDETIFGETVDVRVVNLEVVVVDRQGNRVPGLQATDFRLLVDGKPAKVDYFTEVAEGRAVAEAPAADATAPAAADLPDVAGVQPGGDVGTSYVVFVDDLFTPVPAKRNQVLKSIIDDLERLGPSDRMAIVAFDGRRPRLLASWSGSRAKLRSALETVIARRGYGVATAAEVAHADQVAALSPNESPAEAFGGGGGLSAGGGAPTREDLGLPDSEVTASLCSTIRNLERKLQKVAAGATTTMRGLSGAPGRKVMLLVTGGWPRSPADFMTSGAFAARDDLGGCKLEGARIYEPVYETANRVGFTLYPVVVEDSPQMLDAAAREPLDLVEGGDPARRFSEVQDTAHYLAFQTGGKPLVAGARLHSLETAVADTRSYYWLGFTPSWKGDDRKHKLRVEVNRPGLTVRSRVGFQDLSKKAEIDNTVESALMFGDAGGAEPLKLRFGQVPKSRGKRVKVPLEVVIPMDLVTMVRRGRRYLGELELRVGALNEEGERNEISVIPVKLSGDKKPQPGQVSIYETQVELARVKQDVVVALYDPGSGRLLQSMASIEP